MSIKAILDELKNQPKTNAKKAILEKNKDNELFKRVLKCTLHPQLQTGFKKVPQDVLGVHNPNPTLTLSEALDTMNELYQSRLTGHAARDKIREMLVSLSEDDAYVLERVIMKDLDCGTGETLSNTVFGKNFIPVQPYMRCSLVNEKTIQNITSFSTHGYAVSECKMDGQYLDHVITNTKYVSTSRNGKVYDFLGTKDSDAIKLAEKLKELDPRCSTGVALNGECLATDRHGKYHNRETSNGIVQKAGKDSISLEEAESVVFVLWDYLPYDKFCDEQWNEKREHRRKILEQAIKESGVTSFRMVEYKIVKTIDEAFDWNAELLARGEEGTVLKCENGIWKSHTSPTQLKMKLEMTVDLLITGFNLGASDGKFKHTLGSIRAESADGIIKVNVSGFKEKDAEWTRDVIWDKQDELLGTVISVVSTGLTRDKRTLQYSLFLPRYQEFRTDKNTADDYERILEIKESAIQVLKEKLKSKKK